MNKCEWTLELFRYEHLPDHLQPTSKMFHDAAHMIADDAVTVGGDALLATLEYLLIAKDCAVRAFLAGTRETPEGEDHLDLIPDPGSLNRLFLPSDIHDRLPDNPQRVRSLALVGIAATHASKVTRKG